VAWAPDGSRFAARIAKVQGTGFDIRTTRPDGKAPVSVATGRGFRLNDFAYSPDGAFLALAGSLSDTCDASELRITDTLGAAPTKLVVTGPGSTKAVFPTVDWVDDETLLVSYTAEAGVCPEPGRLATIALGERTAVMTPLTIRTDDETSASSDWLKPALSPDRTKIVFIENTVSSHRAWIVPVTGGDATLLVDHPTNVVLHGPAVWSGDGKTVYIREKGNRDGLAVVAYPVAGGPGTEVGRLAGGEIYRRPVPSGPVRVPRVDGDAVAQSLWVSAGWQAGRGSCADGHAQTPVIASTGEPAAALAAAPLATKGCGPLLLTGGRRLDGRVLTELRRLAPSSRGRTVNLVGSTSAFSAAVTTSLTRAGFTVRRIAGADAAATSVAVAKALGNPKSALLASAKNLGDVLVAAPTAAALGVPVLLTNGTAMPAGTAAYVKRYKVGGWAVGAQAQAAARWATRVGGKDGAATSVAVARYFWYPSYELPIAAAAAPATGLGAALFGAHRQTPVLLSAQASLPASVATYIDASSASVQLGYLFGPTRSLRSSVATQVSKLAGGRREGSGR
jgi:hypothetical protein